MTEFSDYTTKGDTWWLTDHDCPDCQQTLASNSRVRLCHRCKHWEVVGE